MANLLEQLRSKMCVSTLKDMTPEEIDKVFQKLHDKNEALRTENEALKLDVYSQMRSNEELTQWITAISNGHQQVPDWIKQSAKSLLVSQATKGD